MVEKLDDNLENLQSLAHRLHGELDKYVPFEKAYVSALFSDSNEMAQENRATIREGWTNEKVKNPPTYIPMSELPTCEQIDNQQDPAKLEEYISVLFEALRFLTLLSGGCSHDLPVLEEQIEIIGDIRGDVTSDVLKVVKLFGDIRDANAEILPFEIYYSESGKKSCIGNLNLEYIDGYEKLQDTILKTKIAIIVQNAGFDFDEDKMVINID